MHPSHEFELSNKMANRIVGSVFWDQIIALVKQTQTDLKVHVSHVVEDRKTQYETELATAYQLALEINGKVQLRAKKQSATDGSETTQFRIQCRFQQQLNDDGLIGFDQTGRIVNDFAVVDNLVERFHNDSAFSPWIDR